MTECGAIAGTNCYLDGQSGAYDEISQSVSTTIGETYSISFYYRGYGSGTYAANSADMFVYASDPLPTKTPEPASLAVLGVGLLSLGLIRRRKLDTP